GPSPNWPRHVGTTTNSGSSTNRRRWMPWSEPPNEDGDPTNSGTGARRCSATPTWTRSSTVPRSRPCWTAPRGQALMTRDRLELGPEVPPAPRCGLARRGSAGGSLLGPHPGTPRSDRNAGCHAFAEHVQGNGTPVRRESMSERPEGSQAFAEGIDTALNL